MAGRPRTRRARLLVELMVAALRETGEARTAEELLEALAHGPGSQRAGWERAAARMAARDVCAHPHVIADEAGRLHYWARAESNGTLRADEGGDAA